MAEDLVGTVVKSSDPSVVGTRLTFAGVHSATPKVIFATGESSPLQRVFEDDGSMTLLLVASAAAGGDVYVINKKTGTFAAASAEILFSGAIAATGSVGTFK